MRTLKELNDKLQCKDGGYLKSDVDGIAKIAGVTNALVVNVLKGRKIQLSKATEVKIREAAEMHLSNTKKEVKRLFKLMGNKPHKDVVATLATEGVKVWYYGVDADYELVIEFDALLKHAKEYKLNEVQEGLDRTFTYAMNEFVEENLTDVSIHYIQNEGEFETV